LHFHKDAHLAPGSSFRSWLCKPRLCCAFGADNQDHAAGFVVRRITMMNAKANMKAENKISVAILAAKGNA
jgi:hypothetical protein